MARIASGRWVRANSAAVSSDAVGSSGSMSLCTSTSSPPARSAVRISARTGDLVRKGSTIASTRRPWPRSTSGSCAREPYPKWIRVGSRSVPAVMSFMVLLLDGERVRRGTHATDEVERLARQEELVHPVGRAVGGEVVEFPQLAHGHPEERDERAVQHPAVVHPPFRRLLAGEPEVRLDHRVGLDGRGVARDERDLVVPEPAQDRLALRQRWGSVAPVELHAFL